MRGECPSLVEPVRFSLGNKQQDSGMLFQALQATYRNTFKLWSCVCVCLRVCVRCVCLHVCV